ncbi:MAG: PHB depolymerase family esterase [Rhizobiaceae bacterium]
MRKISDTIARLAALQARQNSGTETFGASTRLHPLQGFGSNLGALKAYQYVPSDVGENAPLVVVLHGCTQNAVGYDHHSGWSQLADEEGFAVLFPEQQRQNNPNLCFNWFQPQDFRPGTGEALSIQQMIETMVETHKLDAKRVFITGLSAGGAMTAAMLSNYPEMFAGGAIIAGLPYASAKTVPEAFDRMRGHGGPSVPALQKALRSASDHQGPWPKISIWQGTADSTVAPSNAEAIAEQWKGVHAVDTSRALKTTDGRLTKIEWLSAGNVVIEINMITGMDHGTPIAAGLGAPGPYMLDVGISSTRAIAQFWEISKADGDAVKSRHQELATIPSETRNITLDHAKTRRESPKAHPSKDGDPAHSASGTSGVKQIIEDALRAAGLMR